jgi:anti-sigma B factor antagonist
MEIKEQAESGYITLVPKGELDANSSVYLDARINDLLQAGQVKVHVDFSEVNYISSAGLGVFISYLDEFKRKGGKLIISQVADNVRDVFSILGLDRLLTILDTGAEVAPHFDPSGSSV